MTTNRTSVLCSSHAGSAVRRGMSVWNVDQLRTAVTAIIVGRGIIWPSIAIHCGERMPTFNLRIAMLQLQVDARLKEYHYFREVRDIWAPRGGVASAEIRVILDLIVTTSIILSGRKDPWHFRTSFSARDLSPTPDLISRGTTMTRLQMASILISRMSRGRACQPIPELKERRSSSNRCKRRGGMMTKATIGSTVERIVPHQVRRANQ